MRKKTTNKREQKNLVTNKAKKLNKEKYSLTKISEILGIDRRTVKNSIKYEYDNGLAEGSINKLKVIKRIMYGRNSFEMLKNKVLYIESI
ncbi:transposase [Tepidibacter sp. Z1-5]|uniref:transposase n=1 Tax=Tepidibacter sp. Z1-5 TaxID=3134138 RepID=UPI0030BB4085